jgi:hypothetical protein
MGRGSAKRAILGAFGSLAVALVVAGCGAESHANDPRPPIAAEVTVNVTNTGVQAQPGAVGVKKANSGSIDQNQGHGSPKGDAKAPLVVNFTASNTTNIDTTLEIHGPGGFEKRSGPLVAQGNTMYKVGLPNGHYTIEAADLPGAKPASFFVGPNRISAQNDLLLP